MRRNGLERPLEALQIATWILLVIIVAVFYAFIIPGLQRTTAIGFGCLYGAVTLGVIILGFICCKVDPADRTLAHVANRMRIEGTSQERTFCFLCQVLVNKGSRHCRYCDKCIARFDHHCRWLNNCIGKHNYLAFILLLIMTFSLTGIQFGLSFYMIVEYHTRGNAENSALAMRVSESYLNWSSQSYIIVIYIFAVLVLPFFFLLMQLIGFHMMLAKSGLTTFDYILNQNVKDREKREKMAKKKAERRDNRQPRRSRSSVANEHINRSGDRCGVSIGSEIFKQPCTQCQSNCEAEHERSNLSIRSDPKS